MYKRPVQILFVCADHARGSPMAEAWARTLGEGRVSAHSAGVEPAGGFDARARAALERAGVGWPADEPRPLSDADLAWADLAVSLDAAARAACEALPPSAQHRHWPLDRLAPEPTEPAYDALCGELRRRVEGVLGGVRLLERADT